MDAVIGDGRYENQQGDVAKPQNESPKKASLLYFFAEAKSSKKTGDNINTDNNDIYNAGGQVTLEYEKCQQ